MKVLGWLFIGVSTCFQAGAAQFEVHSTISPGFIRITEYPMQNGAVNYGFELCRNSDDSYCSPIGTRKFYSAAELNYRSQRLKHEGKVMIADDAGWILLGTATAVAAVALTSNPVTGPVLYVIAGTTSVSSIVGVLHSWFIPGNNNTPGMHFKEAKSINIAEFSRENLKPVGIPIEDYASRLNLALSDLY